MKRKIKIVLCCIMTIGFTIYLLWNSTNLMKRKDSDFKYADFFEQESDFDILFLGTSHIGYGVYPMELWNDYGIVSYNLGGHGNPLATTYWTMENALEYTSPKLVVIDCFLLSCMVKTHSKFESAHYLLDAFPNSKVKTDAVFDLLDDKYADEAFSTNEEASARTHLELLWNYSIYHSRWNKLEQNDFEPAFTKEKGAEHVIAIVPSQKEKKIPPESKLEENTVSVEYLKKMIEDCKSRGIDVLLIYLPFAANETCQKEANMVTDIAECYGINYINFLDTDFINYDTDYCDNDYHLNPCGARKVTDYLGQYLTEHYDIPDQRTNEQYNDWHKDYDEYINYKIENLRNLESLDKYLMLLTDKNFSAIIEVNNDQIWENEYYMGFLENLQVEKNKITKDTDFLVIQEAGKHVDYLENFHMHDRSELTSLGTVSLSLDEQADNYRVSLDNKELYSDTKDQNTDIRIIVFDKNTLEVVDIGSFNYQSHYSRRHQNP